MLKFTAIPVYSQEKVCQHSYCIYFNYIVAVCFGQVTIYKTIILPVALYGCETWSLTVREEHKLRVFENRVLRRIFRPKRDGLTGGWRKPHNKELHNLYSSPSIIRIIKSRRMRWAGHVARMGSEEERV
jgi:hypothetical protein